MVFLPADVPLEQGKRSVVSSFEPWLSDLLTCWKQTYTSFSSTSRSASITALSPPGMRSEYGLNGNCEDASSDLCTEISRWPGGTLWDSTEVYVFLGSGDVRAMSLQAWCAKMELAMPNTQVFHWQWLDKKMPKTILINLQSRCLFLHRGSKCYPGQTVVAKCLQGRAAVVACQPLAVDSQVIPVNCALKLDLPQVWDGICWYFGSCLAAAKCGGHLAVSSGSSWIEAFCE